MIAAATKSIQWRASTTPGASVEWGTPPAIYEALDVEFDFTLDAAASGSNAKHVRYVAKDTDALAISWQDERVFCNPPYGRALKAWCAKALQEATEHNALVVMLIPARTDVRWFHDIVLPHAEIRFIRGRLSYTRPGKTGRCNAPFASMVAIFRPGKRLEGTGKKQLLFPFLPKHIGLPKGSP
jgi:phage N-6-adenine-methyltransferase